MRTIMNMLLVLGVLIPFAMNGQEMASNSGYKTFASSVGIEFIDRATDSDLNLYAGKIQYKDKCTAFTKMKKAGTIMTVFGSIALISGFIASNSDADFQNGGYFLSDADIISFLGFTSGVLLTGAGIPLMIVGIVKSKNYCGSNGSTPRIILKSEGNSAGLALIF